TASTPFDMGTFGSLTTPTMNLQLRKVASAARDVLTKRAQSRSKRYADVPLGDLVKGEPLVATITDTTALKPAASWSIAGKTTPKINGRDFVTGRHRYTSDLTRAGMLHGKVVRPPTYGATLVKLDTTAADAMPGVVVVRDGNFLAVAAPTIAQA